jgi:hypothetical protein
MWKLTLGYNSHGWFFTNGTTQLITFS